YPCGLPARPHGTKGRTSNNDHGADHAQSIEVFFFESSGRCPRGDSGGEHRDEWRKSHDCAHTRDLPMLESRSKGPVAHECIGTAVRQCSEAPCIESTELLWLGKRKQEKRRANVHRP